METARLFKNGKSQAVRLPKAYRFHGSQVFIKKMGNSVILIPYHEPWQALVDSLERFSEDFMTERRQPPLEDRESAYQ